MDEIISNEDIYYLTDLVEEFTLAYVGGYYYLVGQNLDEYIRLEDVHIIVSNREEVSRWIEEHISF